ncbi:MAG: hypothetical protein P9M06_07380 [Candidatus Saelkia tenebricola]|nr:hypothetical protein [Candidatus Saelkia tenebricola]
MKYIAAGISIFLILFCKNHSAFSLDNEFKKWIIEENFKYFYHALDKDTGFVYDHILIEENGEQKIGKYTSPTVIGFWAVLLMDVFKGHIELAEFSREDAKFWLEKVITGLENLPAWEGLFYWYEFKEGINTAEDEIISAYDNANLTIALMSVYGAISESKDEFEWGIAKRVYEILMRQKSGWGKLYDKNKGLLHSGYKRGCPLTYAWIDRFYTEGRIAPLIAVLLGDVPKEVWFNLLRPGNCPQGEYVLSDNRCIKFLKPWQGAFQAWLPLLFIPEMDLSPQALKEMHQNYATIQMDYALNSSLKLLRSASANPEAEDEYLYEPSVGILNASEDWVRSDIGSPYATALMYMIYPEASIYLFKETKDAMPQVIGPLGFYDAVSEHGLVAKVYLALDQLQLLLSFFAEINQDYFLKSVEKFGKEDILRELYRAIQFEN